MRQSKLALFVSSFVLLGNFAQAADGPSATVEAAWVKAMLANDLDAVAATYANDAVAWLPDIPETHGRGAIRARYAELLGANTVKSVVLTQTGAKALGNASAGWGRFEIVLQPKAGGDAMTLKGRFSEIVEKRDGHWVYVLDHASAEPPTAAPAK